MTRRRADTAPDPDLDPFGVLVRTVLCGEAPDRPRSAPAPTVSPAPQHTRGTPGSPAGGPFADDAEQRFRAALDDARTLGGGWRQLGTDA